MKSYIQPITEIIIISFEGSLICASSEIKNPHIIPVTSENIKYKLGDEVVITEGEFKDIHGRVARIAGQKRVVVELFDGCLVATAYVPTSALSFYKVEDFIKTYQNSANTCQQKIGNLLKNDKLLEVCDVRYQ